MERISVSNNFFLDEFVDPFTFFTDADHGLTKLDPKLIECVQLLREKANHSININNWWGYYVSNKGKLSNSQIISNIESGNYSKWSGFRSVKCPIGAKASAHKLGKGADPKGDQKALFKIVKDNAKEFYDLGLRRLEDPKITKGWLHMDTNDRNCLPGYINVVDLKSVVERIKAN